MMVGFTGNATYRQLLETAVRLIAEHGCRNTTLQQIMQTTGLSKGAIYHYVKSKEELFGLVLTSQVEAINDSFQRAVEEQGNLTGPLAAIADGLTKLQEKDSVVNQIIIYLLAQKDKSGVTALLQQYHERAATAAFSWIDMGQREGVINPKVDARKASEHFVMLSYGMCMRNMMMSEAGESSARSFEKEDFYNLMLQHLK
jgi:AcrR family transcriptional regulator